MNLLLDTSAIIEFLKGNQKVRDSIAGSDNIYTSSICVYEVLVGEMHSEMRGLKSNYQRALSLFSKIEILQLTQKDATAASEITAKLMLKGKKVNDFDVLIGTQALAAGAPILTADAKHFRVLEKEAGVLVKKIV